MDESLREMGNGGGRRRGKRRRRKGEKKKEEAVLRQPGQEATVEVQCEETLLGRYSILLVEGVGGEGEGGGARRRGGGGGRGEKEETGFSQPGQGATVEAECNRQAVHRNCTCECKLCCCFFPV